MDNFRAKLKFFGAVPMGSLTSADMKLLIGEAWTQTGEFWHRTLRPRHFQADALSEYGYARRKRRYLARKRAKWGHIRPLVWSGELEQATRARRIETRTFRTRSRMRVVLPLARKANWRHPASQVNLREELTAVSDRDAERMVAVHNRTMSERLRSFGRSVTKTIQ